MSEGNGKDEPFVLFSESEFEGILARGDDLYRNPEKIADYFGPELMSQLLLVGESAKKLIKGAGSAKKLEEALKMVALGYKGHEAWRNIGDPLAKRLLVEMKKGLKDGRTAKQVSGSSGSHPRLGPGRGRGAGQAHAEAQPTARGSNRAVEAQHLGSSDGQGPGDGSPDHLDDRPEGQEEPA